MNPIEIENLLKQHFPQHDHITVQTADQVHFEAIIVSQAFEGLSRIARQRKVYEALGPYLQSGQIHALALKTHTPQEWQEAK